MPQIVSYWVLIQEEKTMHVPFTTTKKMESGELVFDYINQCWIQDGIIQRCGHPENMDCNCYGKAHEGESLTPGA